MRNLFTSKIQTMTLAIPRERLTIASLLFGLLLVSSKSHAGEKPLWEVGVGFGGVNQAFYSGTNERRTIAFPVSAPIYRGKIFKSDDEGMRAEIIKDSRYKLDLSLDFNFSIDSDEIDLRQGMDDIGHLLQVGPSLEVNLKDTNEEKWLFRAPVRFATEILDRDISSAGFTISPGLTYYRFFEAMERPWRLGLHGDVLFGSERYHDVYYSVEQRDANDSRAVYEADAGYSGYRFTASLMSNANRHLFVLFLRYEDIGDAVFADSPLVETNSNVTFGLLYSYSLFQSKTRVNN